MKNKTIFLVSILLISTLTVGVAFAHEGHHGMKGTVTSITADNITIKTTAKKTVNIHFDKDTVFEKSGKAATVKDLKTGDHVIVEAHDMSGMMHAMKVRFGAPAPKAKADKMGHMEMKH